MDGLSGARVKLNGVGFGDDVGFQLGERVVGIGIVAREVHHLQRVWWRRREEVKGSFFLLVTTSANECDSRGSFVREG